MISSHIYPFSVVKLSLKLYPRVFAKHSQSLHDVIFANILRIFLIIIDVLKEQKKGEMMHNLNGIDNAKILFADDDDMFRETTAKTLKKLFSEVYTASNGTEALALYRTLNPHVVMLDIRMGEISGLHVAKEIRKENVHIPIFIVSSYAETNEILEACELNLVKYLVKPFTYESLVCVLKKCLRVCHEETELFQNINPTTQYNPYSKRLLQEGKNITLTKNEILVLEYMLSKKGGIVAYETLMCVLGDSLSTIALQNLVFRLRKKLGHNSIQNLAKVGYILT